MSVGDRVEDGSVDHCHGRLMTARTYHTKRSGWHIRGHLAISHADAGGPPTPPRDLEGPYSASLRSALAATPGTDHRTTREYRVSGPPARRPPTLSAFPELARTPPRSPRTTPEATFPPPLPRTIFAYATLELGFTAEVC